MVNEHYMSISHQAIFLYMATQLSIYLSIYLYLSLYVCLSYKETTVRANQERGTNKKYEKWQFEQEQRN